VCVYIVDFDSAELYLFDKIKLNLKSIFFFHKKIKSIFFRMENRNMRFLYK